jgi:hypothetical protein
VKKPPKIQIDSDSEDGDGNNSGSDLNFPHPVETCRTSQRPKRERKFRNLSEMERARLKNIPTHERVAILAGAKTTDEVQSSKKISKLSERNQLSKENPFHESLTSSRGAKSAQQQRGKPPRTSVGYESSDVDGQFHTDSARREIPIQIDYNASSQEGTARAKKFRLQTHHGKLSPSSRMSSTILHTDLSKFAEERFVSDSDSDTTDIYTTEDL